jgi:hypothetical protein
MAIIALTGLNVTVAAATSGGTAPGGVVAPTGCTLTTPTDISAYVTAIQQEVDFDTPDITTFGAGGFRAFVFGLKQGKLQLTLLQDYAVANLNGLVGNNGSVIPVGSSGFIEVRPTNAARSTSNPGFVAKVLNQNFQTFNAQVGAVPTCAWSVQITGGFAELVA